MIIINDKYALSESEQNYQLHEWAEVTVTDKETKEKYKEMGWSGLTRYYPANTTGLKQAIKEVARRLASEGNKDIHISHYVDRFEQAVNELNHLVRG